MTAMAQNAGDTAVEQGQLLRDCDDAGFLRRAVEELWGIIDDIDTTGDMVKGNDEAFRARVERLQRKRWDLGITSDGYDLYLAKSDNAAQD